MINIIFKTAESGDIDLLLEIMKEFYIIEHLNYDEMIIRKTLQEIISNKNFGFVYLINIDNKPVGYIILTYGFSIEFHGRDALVDEFYIRENYRRLGIGTTSLEHIEDECRKNNIKAIHLEVDHTNVRAKELYHRVGYKDHKRYLLTKWL